MRSSIACEALRTGKCLELRYDDFARIVEVHAVGASSDGRELMRVWQVRGGSSSGEPSGWKLMRLDEARSAQVTEHDSWAPREGYKRDDPALREIICQV